GGGECQWRRASTPRPGRDRRADPNDDRAPARGGTAGVPNDDPALRYARRVRDPALLQECHALQRVIAAHPTVQSLRASRAWPEINDRFERLLARIHRHLPADPPPDRPPGAPLRAVHWNIEHGNWYEQVERALLERPALRDADL